MGGFSSHSEIDRKRHAFRRRVLDHAFSESAVRSASEFIEENVRTWIGHLDDADDRDANGWSRAKNMTVWASYLSYDIIGDLAFGKRFNCLEHEEHRHVPRMMMNSTGFTYLLTAYEIGFLPFIKLVRPLLGTKFMDLVGGQNAQDNKAFAAYANAQLEQRIAAETQNGDKPARRDFTHYLLESRDPTTGRGFTLPELRAESGLLIAAGSDTTSITISAALFYLLRYPDALAKTTQEVRAAFATAAEISAHAAHASLPYMRAVVDETLRMAPPVPSHLPREVLPGGLIIDGHMFPAGTVVGTAPYAIHHRADYFPEPFVFRPERWIVGAAPGVTEDSVATARAAFCPFSLGTRGCVGKRVGYLEVMLALAVVLFTYDIRKGAGEPSGGGGAGKGTGRENEDQYQLDDKFVADRDGPMVEFKRRV